ncbi:MAG TPA: hypothetical protein VLA43_01745, partial [Longimicrobiales bacterium]|nr:hypothetical protein [Longimicrobiales bacterium]
MRTIRGWTAAAAAALLVFLGGCGEETVEPDAALAALVGDWEATSLVLTNVANPAVSPDLIELGATFDLNVPPSGQYTAILIVASQFSTEIGQISVSGSSVTLRPSFPPGQPATSGTYSVQGDRMALDGTTEFDFNLDGTPEAA